MAKLGLIVISSPFGLVSFLPVAGSGWIWLGGWCWLAFVGRGAITGAIAGAVDGLGGVTVELTLLAGRGGSHRGSSPRGSTQNPRVCF